MSPAREDPAARDPAAAARALARPLDEAGLAALVERLASAQLVLLGEASHGTREYYAWRARITERLVRDHRFRFVAVEGDWPDLYRVDRYAKGLPGSGADAREVLGAMDRWPTWMWANDTFADHVEALRALNDRRPPDERCGVYGIDVYSLYESLRAVLAYAERLDHVAAEAARRAFACFQPYGDPQAYARSMAFVPDGCRDEVVAMLAAVRREAPHHAGDPDSALDAEQNAVTALNAERYYRTMVGGGAASWNLRDTHMADTLERLLAWHGPGAKGVVWAHNTHVGDARATDMVHGGMVNLGELMRDRLGRDRVALAGFGSHRGRVIAASEWGAEPEVMRVPPARPGSLEDVLRRAGPREALLLLDDAGPALRAPLDHRAIGVVYDPAMEAYGNYVPTVLPERYDAFVFLEETEALQPLGAEPRERKVPETFPSGY